MTVGPLEVILLAILVLLLVGGRRLPQAGRSLGGGIRSLIDGVRGLHPSAEESSPPRELEEPKPAKKQDPS